MIVRSRVLLSWMAVLALWIGQSAAATTVHPSYTGPQIDFTLIQETTQAPPPGFGPPDAEPLFGAPTGSGNDLVFSPPAFIATAGGGSLDSTHSLLRVDMESINPLVDAIEFINITEFGDASLTAFPPGSGSAATGVYIQMTGTLTIIETTAGAINESFTWGGTFNVGTPAGMGATYIDLLSNPGATSWTGSVSLDVAALLATQGIYDAATKAILQFDNILQAGSEVGTSATVQKKAAGPGVIIEVIPEPTTGLLLVGGLVVLGVRARRVRA